jgi:hypothetical protein
MRAVIGVSLARRALAPILLGWRAVRYLLLVVVLLLSMAGPARADDGLIGAVEAAYFPRYVDDGLHAIAHQRAEELRACNCLDHDGMRPGTAEVLYTSTLMPNPAQSAVASWMASPLHNGILSDRSYGRIGCADAVDGDTHWIACVLATGPLPPSEPSTLLLPDTAIAARGPSATAGRAQVRPI